MFTICCTGLGGGQGVISALAIGSALMVMIYAGGHISGGHFNPAVTLGVWIRGRCAGKDVIPYVVFQITGAMLASLAAKYLTAAENIQAFNPDYPRALLAEFLFTFALVYVVLNVATAKANANNSYYGLAIGFTVMTGIFSVGYLSGGAFNPAVAIGASFIGMFKWVNIWIYLAANLLGGAAAGMMFKFLNTHDK